jgi:hypothetical protein
MQPFDILTVLIYICLEPFDFSIMADVLRLSGFTYLLLSLHMQFFNLLCCFKSSQLTTWPSRARMIALH